MKSKLLIIMTVLILLSQLNFSESSGAENTTPPNAVILYTGDIRGNINPVGCCSKIGGIAGLGSKIQELKKKYTNSIIIDTGDYLYKGNKEDWFAQIEGAHIAKAFRAIQYDAVNIADGEIMAGDTFFDSFLSDPVFPLISTNMHLTENNNESVKPYIIKKIGKFRFGIIGILSDHFFKESSPDSITIKDPVAAIKKYLPEIQKKSDFIILMSHCGMIKTRELLKELPDIDIAILGHDLYPDFEPELFQNTWILKNSYNGGTVGIVRLWIDQSGRINNIETNLELIDMKVKIMPEYSMIETDFISEIRKMGTADNRLKLEIEKAKKNLELSPEEFFKQRENKKQIKQISNVQN